MLPDFSLKYLERVLSRVRTECKFLGIYVRGFVKKFVFG